MFSRDCGQLRLLHGDQGEIPGRSAERSPTRNVGQNVKPAAYGFGFLSGGKFVVRTRRNDGGRPPRSAIAEMKRPSRCKVWVAASGRGGTGSTTAAISWSSAGPLT